MILASIDNVNPQTIKDFFLIALALLTAAALIRNFFRGNKAEPREIYPQPLEIKASAAFVERKEFDHMIERNDEIHNQLFAKINGADRGTNQKLDSLRLEMHDMELRLNKSSEERTANVHERVNEVLGEVRELKGEIKKL